MHKFPAKFKFLFEKLVIIENYFFSFFAKLINVEDPNKTVYMGNLNQNK